MTKAVTFNIVTKLTDAHRAFIAAYDGDGVKACRLAGYPGDDRALLKKTEELLAQPLIVEAIKERSRHNASLNKAIADSEEVQAFWTSIMRNKDPYQIERFDPLTNMPLQPKEIEMTQRQKSSENLAKAQGLFVERIDMKLQADVSQIIMKSYGTGNPDDDMSLDAIEAEYTKMQSGNTAPIEPPAIPVLNVSLEDLI